MFQSYKVYLNLWYKGFENLVTPSLSCHHTIPQTKSISPERREIWGGHRRTCSPHPALQIQTPSAPRSWQSWSVLEENNKNQLQHFQPPLLSIVIQTQKSWLSPEGKDHEIHNCWDEAKKTERIVRYSTVPGKIQLGNIHLRYIYLRSTWPISFGYGHSDSG